MVDVQRLNDTIRDTYGDWLNAAAPGYFKDDFFLESRPMVITCCFGQDQPICLPGQRDVESMRWMKERAYDKMRFMSFSLASHFS